MTPKLLSEEVGSPLPWKLDKLHGLVDNDGYPIGLGGTDNQKLAFIEWLQRSCELSAAVQWLYDSFMADGKEGKEFTEALDSTFVAMTRCEQALALEDDEDLEDGDDFDDPTTDATDLPDLQRL